MYYVPANSITQTFAYFMHYKKLKDQVIDMEYVNYLILKNPTTMFGGIKPMV